MQSYKKYISLFLLLFAVAVAMVVPNLLGQGQSKKVALSRENEESITPVVDVDAPEPADPKQKAVRRARNKRHDYPGDPADAKRFVLNEDSTPVAFQSGSDGPKLYAIPAQESDAVIIGEVTDARAYLSNDKTHVYSEFTIVLEDVLKDSTALLYPRATIATERLGVTVKLRSGKTLVRGAGGRTMPRVGQRYVLFLNYDKEAQTFPIITGYELRGGKVIPLDGLTRKSPDLAVYAAHEGADETTFINAVRQAVIEGVNK